MEEKRKPKDFIFVRKIRPRYNKLLIPALIISFIIAVILIMILKKYLLDPLLEQQGLDEVEQSALVMIAKNPYEAQYLSVFSS